MAMQSRNGTISRQIDALQDAVEDTAKQGGEQAIAIAEKGRQILTLARELAGDIAHVTRETVSAGAGNAYRRVRDTAQYETEVARETVRNHPLLAVAGVAVVSALIAVAVTSAVRHESKPHRWW
jgi:hypothetical protein